MEEEYTMKKPSLPEACTFRQFWFFFTRYQFMRIYKDAKLKEFSRDSS